MTNNSSLGENLEKIPRSILLYQTIQIIESEKTSTLADYSIMSNMSSVYIFP